MSYINLDGTPLSGPAAYWDPPTQRIQPFGADAENAATDSPKKSATPLIVGVVAILGALWLAGEFGTKKKRRNPRRDLVRAAKRAQATRRRRARRGPSRWMKGAVQRPGALRRKVERWYGARGFDQQGRIKVSVLRKLKATGGPRGDTRTKRQANLALVFRRSS